LHIPIELQYFIHYKRRMATKIDDTSVLIAQRIRLERTVRGWSLKDLADKSGVAKATISKIEREEMSPSAVILVRLAGAFDLTLAGLLIRAEGNGERLCKVKRQPTWRDPETGYLRTQVFCQADNPLELVKVELPARKKIAFPPSSYARIRQVIWVIKGRLVIDEASTRHELAVGDCLGFGPPSEVTIANESEKPCTYLVAVSRS
jgi:transcriptional regulator with XRE-family HTH domain